MGDGRGKNVVIILLITIITILSTILVLVSTGHLNLNNEDSNLNNSGNHENNKENHDDLLTEAEALQLGDDLYRYANRVGWCEEFEYLNNPSGGAFVLNYEEVASKFTQNYIDSGTNSMDYVFRTIKKDEDGNYYDLSMCAFGSGLVERTLELKVVNISENYITFDAIITTIGTIDKDYKEIKTQTFGIKKEDNNWKIDVYKFAML